MITSEAFQKYLTSDSFLEPLGLELGTELEFILLGQGEYNINYTFVHPVSGQKLVLRINTGSQMHLDNQISYEFSALQDLVLSGRTPKPLFCDDSRERVPYGILVMEWLPGGPLCYETDLDVAAEILADIHCVPVLENSKLIRPEYPAQAIYDECLEMVEHYFTWDDANPESVRLLKILVDEMGKLPLKKTTNAPLCMVNTEVNSGNFLINRDGTSYLVDWEKPLLSEPAQDLGHFLVPTTTFWKTDTILTTDQVRDFTEKYIAAVGDRMDTSTLRERLPVFFTVTCLRGVTWCAMAMREYSQPGRELTNDDTFIKIKAYLEPEFLTNILENYVRADFLKGGEQR